MAVGRIVELHDYFSCYIRDRVAYYLDGNVLCPLTEPAKTSYAELVGAEIVQFFVLGGRLFLIRMRLAARTPPPPDFIAGHSWSFCEWQVGDRSVEACVR